MLTGQVIKVNWTTNWPPRPRRSNQATTRAIAHDATSPRIVVPPLVVKNFLPKHARHDRFDARWRKIGHSRYNSVSSVVKHTSCDSRTYRAAYSGCSDYGCESSACEPGSRYSRRNSFPNVRHSESGSIILLHPGQTCLTAAYGGVKLFWESEDELRTCSQQVMTVPMPELPEVETMVRGIRAVVEGQIISAFAACPCKCRPLTIRPSVNGSSR